MTESTVWWLLAGAMVAVELATGTFYLLMVSLGFIASAIAAHLGLGINTQIITAAVVGGGAVAAWHWLKGKGPQSAPANSNRDVHIDIGEPVRVEQWNGDGTATVKYRGANWTAIAADAGSESPLPGLFRIKELLGNRLVVERL
jgi:membrane protein implicated in regulation of membrane protease activity